MVWKVPEKTLLLVFESGDPFEGAEIRLRLDLPMEMFFDIARVVEGGAIDTEAVRAAMIQFGDRVLKSWNVGDDDGEYPANGTGILKLPPDLAIILMRRWAEEATTVRGPLGSKSNGTLPVAEISH